MNQKIRLFILLWVFVSTHVANAAGTDTITIDHNKEIVFGMSGSLTGHFSFYGTTIRDAIECCFKHINTQGLIQGKTVRLICLDDQGDPEKTQANVEFLYNNHGVTMFIGIMGTRGILSILPMVKAKKIALFFPWGGNEELKSSSLSYLINGPGLLEPQLEKLANHVVNDLKLSHVAIFHADDDFSSAGAQYLVQLLKKLGQEPVGVERYNRFTLNIYTPAQKLVDKDPRAIFCISTSMPTVKLINYFFENGCISTRFFGIDSTFLVKDILRFKGVPFHYASSVPDPVVSTIPLAQEYRNDLAKYFMDEDPNVLSFSYYLGARLITDALKKVSTPISADTVLDQLSAMKETEFGGMPIHFDGNNRHIFGQKIWII